VTRTIYESTVMGGAQCFFGVNFADGRIKCYPTRRGKGYYAIYVRGPRYGENDFAANGDGTITDRATGLVWQQADNGAGINWVEALATCEDLVLAGEDDWRLPNAKELQSIVDYTRSPDTTGSAAIHPVFSTSRIINEAGQADYPFYWTSTTHVRERGAADAVYVSFGRALGYMRGRWLDVHGAGAQRSDPKAGSPEDFPTGLGPQGDARRSTNHVRCVRGGAEPSAGEPARTAPKTVAVPSRPRRGRGGPPGRVPPGGSSARHFPPQEAIDACRGKNDGAACSFVAPHGAVSGRCRTMRRQQACAPARPPRGRPPA
ncbi:MAG: DUF1566 domain-containing protein, partial [bacterium]|nr:DUF1566 domain-containing protein [bacterium]